VEACASTGGQIAPPVMGAAAFVMAEFIGLPYVKIAAYAAIPAILYYFSLFMNIDLEAGKTGLKAVPAEELPSGKQVRRHMPILIPIAVLVAMLVKGYSAMMAGAYASLAIVIVSWFDKNKEHVMTPRRILKALELSGRRTVTIAVACALSGIIIGVVQYTGLGINFVSLVSSLSGIAWICPILVAVASIILGMGVPTTVAYIIVVAVSVPAMKHLGFGILPSHMFAFYFAVISMITPPVAPASLAASELAGASFFSVGWQACKLGFVTFLVPFMFLYEPALLLQGSPGYIVWVFITSCIAIFAITIALKGWLGVNVTMLERVLFAVGGLVTMIPIPGYIDDFIGLSLIVITYFILMKRKSSLGKSTSTEAI
jgi:TRAP transporter 4TM/12TM fusion protein